MPYSSRKPSKVEAIIDRLAGEGKAEPLSLEEIRSRLKGAGKEKLTADAVFQGGGVKGIAFCGAVGVCEAMGYEWNRIAGTSAGAISACLLAAGYTSAELTDIITNRLDFRDFMDEDRLSRSLPGKVIAALFKKGIYRGDFFETWIAGLLADRGLRTFGDVKDSRGEYRLKLICSDLTRREMIVLPDELGKYGIDPDRYPVAKAARMSMSIPYFFRPVTLKSTFPGRAYGKSYIVDGGLLSNFPVWLFDSETAPRWPTFGFRLCGEKEGQPSPSRWPHQYALSLVSTMMEAHDREYIEEADFRRTVPIPSMGIRTTQFDLSDEDKNMLLRSGQEAAVRFFESWSFRSHVRDRRNSLRETVAADRSR